MFKDRTDAGIRLAHALKFYRDQDVIVLAIPKGGAEIGYQAAKFLHAPFSLLIARKLPFRENPEAGFGAIAEDGSTFFVKESYRWLSQEELDEIREEQIREIERRIQVLRENRPFPDIKGKSVILVDDGLAMGSTMRAAIMMCRNHHAKEIIAAVPVAGEHVANEMRGLADAMIVLDHPALFRAVADAYENWKDVSDGDVVDMMKKYQQASMVLH